MEKKNLKKNLDQRDKIWKIEAKSDAKKKIMKTETKSETYIQILENRQNIDQ